MATEADLRSALDELAAEAPDPVFATTGVVVPRQRRRPHVRAARRLAPIGAALVVAGVVLGVMVTVYGSRGGRPVGAPATSPGVADPCATASTPEFGAIAMREIPGVRLDPRSGASCAGYRGQEYDSAAGKVFVTVYGPGVFDTSLLAGARHIAGNGIAGYYGSFPYYGSYDRSPEPKLPGVTWAYAPDAWASIAMLERVDLAGKSAEATALLLAAAVDPANTTDFKVPFRLTSRPTGAWAYHVEAGPLVAGDIGAGAALALPGHPAISCEPIGGLDCPLSVSISQINPSIDIPMSEYAGQRVTVNGSPAVVTTYPPIHLPGVGSSPTPARSQPTARMLVTTVRGWNVYVGTTVDSLPTADLVRIAEGVVLAASASDRSTWFDANSAFSH